MVLGSGLCWPYSSMRDTLHHPSVLSSVLLFLCTSVIISSLFIPFHFHSPLLFSSLQQPFCVLPSYHLFEWILIKHTVFECIDFNKMHFALDLILFFYLFTHNTMFLHPTHFAVCSKTGNNWNVLQQINSQTNYRISITWNTIQQKKKKSKSLLHRKPWMNIKETILSEKKLILKGYMLSDSTYKATLRWQKSLIYRETID